MRESVVESADSAVQLANYWSRPMGNWPSGYGPLVYIHQITVTYTIIYGRAYL